VSGPLSPASFSEIEDGPQLELDALKWPFLGSSLLPSSMNPELQSLDFNALAYSHDRLVQMVPEVILHTGCIESCNVDRECLRNWAGAVRRLYRDNPFHSWFHAFAVYQMCYYQLFISKQSARLRFIDILGLLVAALSHDIDHPGYTNSFLVSTEDDLALRYNDVSVLENYHASCACELLRGVDTNVGSGVKKSSQQALRRIIIKCILDTDMTHHNELCQKIQSGQLKDICNGPAKEDTSPEHRQILLSVYIHTSDLSGQVLPWEVASQWEERISREFVNQAAKEVEAGLSPAPFMQFSLDDIKQRGKLQRNFVDFVLTPLWGPFTDVIPEFRPCYENLIFNRGKYDYRSTHGRDDDDAISEMG